MVYSYAWLYGDRTCYIFNEFVMAIWLLKTVYMFTEFTHGYVLTEHSKFLYCLVTADNGLKIANSYL